MNDALEPYTEENKETMEEIKDYPPYLDRPKHIVPTMEEKELNLAELLKGCEGEKFYHLLHGNVTLEKVLPTDIIDEDGDIESPAGIYFIINLGYTSTYIALSGHWDNKDKGIVIFYPSRALYEKYPLDAYSAWMEWKGSRRPKRWRAKQYEKYWYLDRRFIPKDVNADANSEFDSTNYENGNYFRTKEEAQQAAEVVKEALRKFYEQISEK